MDRTIYLLALTFFLVSGVWRGHLLSQNCPSTTTIRFEWLPTKQRIVYVDKELNLFFPNCKSCQWDSFIPNLPVRRVELAPPPGFAYEIAEISAFDQNLTADWYSYVDESLPIPTVPIQLDAPRFDGGKWRQVLNVFPIHNAASTWRICDSVTFRLRLIEATDNTPARKTTFATESKLSTGRWVRVAIRSEGIYRIDAGLLRELGFDPASIDPRQFGVFGRGGGMLPQENSADNEDDLPEVTIAFVGNAEDGRWDEGDYAVFYGQGPNRSFTGQRGQLTHENHLYGQLTYYYISPTAGTGKRIIERPQPEASKRMSQVTQYQFIDEDKTNLLKMGRLWFGDDFRFTPRRTYTFNTPDPAPGSRAKLLVRAAGRDNSATQMEIQANARELPPLTFRGVSTLCYFCKFADLQIREYSLTAEQLGDNLVLDLRYQSNGTSNAWLDYIVLEYERIARWNDQGFGFWIKATEDQEAVRIDWQNLRPGLWLWETTSSTEIFSLSLAEGGFRVRADANRRFWIFDPAQAQRPEPAGTVNNQNLHATPPVDYVIFTPEAWRSEAERLAEFHRNTYLNVRNEPRRVLVVTDRQVYHEFSSGTPDITAYRNFLRMLYERANGDSTQAPSLALFFGDGSYDNRQLVVRGAHLPTYQARESLYPPEAFASDDYIGFLDPDEGFWAEGTGYFEGDTRKDAYEMEVAVGRLPVGSIEEARTVVDKIISYTTDSLSFGPWRNRTLLAADFKFSGNNMETNHMREADGLDRDIISVCSPCTQVDKLYMDSYPWVRMADGLRYPSVTRELIDRIEQGRLIINYTGHGGVTGLSNSYIFEMRDILRLSNRNRLSFWTTATCDFGRYDDPEIRSGAEALVMNPNGGAIGMMTSVRQVFSDGNDALNRNFFRAIFSCGRETDGSLGYALRDAKNRIWRNYPINTRNFALLADPGLTLVKPRYRAVITHINNTPLEDKYSPDTLRALAEVSVRGELRDHADRLISDANGLLDVVVMDKPQRMTTQIAKFNYLWNRNRLFTGKASIKAGQFDFRFVVPLDISYEVGPGNIILYAQTSWMDAAGCTDRVIICCTDPKAGPCEDRPQITLSINDRQWRNGGLTHPNPVLIADFSDQRGMNSTGTGIGREIVALLNGNEREPFVLTPFYEGWLDDHRRGTLRYRFENLPEGQYTLDLTAWNVCNLSSSEQVRFRVGKADVVELADVRIYPNPAHDRVTFSFSHNLPAEYAKVRLHIFDLQGRLVESLQQNLNASGSLSQDVVWDTSNSRIVAGLYLYRLEVFSDRLGSSTAYHGRLIVQP